MFLEKYVNCKSIQTAWRYNVDSSKLRKAVNYFEENQNLTPKVVNIKYMIDKWHEPKSNIEQYGFMRWLWAVHGQVIIISKVKLYREYFNDCF